MSVEFVHGFRLKFQVYELREWIWGHGIGLCKIDRGKRIQFVGLAPQAKPPLQWY